MRAVARTRKYFVVASIDRGLNFFIKIGIIASIVIWSPWGRPGESQMDCSATEGVAVADTVQGRTGKGNWREFRSPRPWVRSGSVASPAFPGTWLWVWTQPMWVPLLYSSS